MASKEYQSYLSSYHLRQMCPNNMNGTSSAIHSGRPAKKNFFRQIFDRVINSCTKLFTEREEPGLVPSSFQSSETNSSPQDEGFVEINVGEQFAEQLCRKFGDSKLILPKGFEPVIEIPEALGRQLYAAYVEAVFRQQEAHDRIAAQSLVIEDEEFAKKLQKQEERDQSQGAAASSKVFLEQFRPSNYTKKKEFTAQDFINFDDVAVIDIPSTPQQYEHHIDIEEKKGKDIDGLDEPDSKFQTFPYPATFYRDQAQKYLKQREQFYSKANQCLKSKDSCLAKHYFMRAKELTKLYEQANNFAAAAFLIENQQKNPSKNTIDLHHLYVKEAIQALDIFLDNGIYSLQDHQVSDTMSLNVITGRGRHSPNGIPKIKPAVKQRLDERDLRYTEINPGHLKVRIYKNSYLTSDLRRGNVY